MRAIVLRAHGGAENLQLEDVSAPEVQPGTVLVRVAATSVNRVDIRIRQGLPIGASLPAVIGCDFAGTVEALGVGVTDFAVGDAVWACGGGVAGQNGALAEYIVADARLVAQAPSNISSRDAASMPLVAITAWEAVERAGVKAGDHVLVHGGLGGVGSVAIQLAKIRGARVATTLGSSDDVEIAAAFSADDFILYKDEGVAAYVERLTAGRGFDAIIDTVGGDNLLNSFSAAALEASISTTASRTTLDLSAMHAKGLSLHVIFMLIPMLHDLGRERHGRILRQIADMVEANVLRPYVYPRRFDLAHAGDAHSHVEGGSSRGKVMIDVSVDP